jgi:bacterial/archaeal transporter family-2 protein
MQTGLAIFCAVLIGVVSAIYLPMNSSVARYLGSSLTANISFYSVALVTAILIFVIFGEFETIHNFKIVPPYLYLTGFVSAFIVLGITFLIPVLGARKLVILSIAGQLIMAIIVSHFGVLESPEDPINLRKILGASLLFTGALVSVS